MNRRADAARPPCSHPTAILMHVRILALTTCWLLAASAVCGGSRLRPRSAAAHQAALRQVPYQRHVQGESVVRHARSAARRRRRRAGRQLGQLPDRPGDQRRPGDADAAEGARVSAAEVDVLRRWIDADLPWQEGFSFRAAAYEPPLKPRRPELPPAEAGVDNPIDRIVMHYWREHGVTPPPPLERRRVLPARQPRSRRLAA